MQRALAIGHAVATAKHATLAGVKLLLVQPLGPGDRPDGEPFLAADQLGAGAGQMTIVSSDGKHAQTLFGKTTPCRYVVVGLEDAGQ